MSTKRFTLCIVFILFIIFIIDQNSFAANYYVSNNGSDSANGLSEGTPWRSISRCNKTDFSSGDNINFKCGDTFKDATLTLSGITGSGKSITIQSYGSGNRPLFDGDSIFPFNISNTSINSLTIQKVEISGQGVSKYNAHLNTISKINNVYLYDIMGNGAGGSSLGNVSGQEGHGVFYISGGNGFIEISKCDFYNWGPDNMPIDGSSECYVFEIDGKSYGSFSVHDNIAHDINADAIQVRVFKGDSSNITSNTFYNCGENAVDIKASSNIEISGNNFFREPTFVGHGGIGGQSTSLIGVIPSTEAGGGESNNIIIRNNYLHHNSSDSIYIGYVVSSLYCKDIEIYNNIFSETGPIIIGTSSIRTKIYANNFTNCYNSCIYENNSNSGTIISGNTLTGGPLTVYGILMEYTNASVIENNVVNLSNPSPDSFCLNINYASKSPSFINNKWFNSLNSNRVIYQGKKYSSSNLSLWTSITSVSESFDLSKASTPTIVAPSNLKIIH